METGLEKWVKSIQIRVRDCSKQREPLKACVQARRAMGTLRERQGAESSWQWDTQRGAVGDEPGGICTWS